MKPTQLPYIVTEEDMQCLRERTQQISPAFPDRNIAVVTYCSHSYLPIVSVLMRSVIEHSTADNHYDIIIIGESVTENDIAIFHGMVAEYPHISVRLADGTPWLELIRKGGILQEDFAWNLCESFRLYAPLVCRNYEKVVCLAADTFVRADIAELYNTELGEHPVGGVTLLWENIMNRRRDAMDEKVIPKPWEYEDMNSLRMPSVVYYRKLGLSETVHAFNGDVLLLNITLLLRENFVREGLNLLFKERYRTLTESVYWKLLAPRRLPLDDVWNCPSLLDIYRSLDLVITDEDRQVYAETARRAKILHFMGAGGKPWGARNTALDHEWWQTARKTPFCEAIMKMAAENIATQAKQDVKEWLRVEKKVAGWKRKVRLCRVIRPFTFGCLRRYLSNKIAAGNRRILQHNKVI